jgi:hypothetical protein
VNVDMHRLLSSKDTLIEVGTRATVQDQTCGGILAEEMGLGR